MDPDASARTRRVSLTLALMTAAFIVVKTGRDALYVRDDGLVQMPWAYVGIALLSGPVAMTVLALMRRLGPRVVRICLPLGTAAVLLAYAPFATPGGGLLPSLFFAFVPLVWGVMFSASWLLGADLLDTCPRRVLAHSYARIGASSIAGGVLGGLYARLVSNVCQPADLVAHGAVLLLVSVAVTVHTQSRFPSVLSEVSREADTGGKTPSTSPSLFRHRYARLLLVLAMLGGLVGVLVEYQFYLAAGSSGSVDSARIEFFSTFYTAVGVIGLLLQLWVTPRLQSGVGIEGSLLVLPSGLLLGASAVVFGGGTLLARTGLRLTEGGLKSSIHRSNWEQAYLALPRKLRSHTKVVVDGMGARFGEALAASALLVGIHLSGDGATSLREAADWVTWSLLASATAWVVMTVWLRRVRGAAPAPAARDGSAVPVPDS
ncbi:MAG TPA: hypothetical protein VKA86_17320 [Candidatus Krumholzibacteria bacterium]|nr:hypothetical protein [Candidatus Krumholzibacteria bacterium]